ncbi:MAG: hypothetical protein ABEJ99_00340 [Candidatus Nanohaloarchaea archaeon]
MMEVKFSDLPDETRVKFTDKGEKEFWHRIDEFGGIKTFSGAFNIPSSRMYNWKSKSSFIPVKLVKTVMGNENSDEIKAFKGRGRGKTIEDPEFPLKISDELLTRIDASVNVNKNGSPVYQASDPGLVERFNELLQEIGSVPVRIYHREVYELQYPKFLQDLMSDLDYVEDFTALVDEKGEVDPDTVVAEGKKVALDDFDGELYSRVKALDLALARGDSEKVARIMSEEARKVRSLAI